MSKKMSSTKDVLFYSNFCEFSKNVLVHIQKRDCRDSFILVCVDNPAIKSKLPRQVDHVPIIITKFKHIMSGDNIIKYIDTFGSMKPSAQPPAQPQTERAVEMSQQSDGFGTEPAAFSLLSDMNSISETYTFIDNDGSDNRIRGFDYLNGGGPNSHMDMTGGMSMQSRIETEKKSKIDEAYEKYISDRDADISKIFGNNRPIRS